MGHLLTTVKMQYWLLRRDFILMKCISLITTMTHYIFLNNHANSSVGMIFLKLY